MDRFQKIRELSEGENTTTYLVKRKSDDTEFVLKQIDIGELGDDHINIAQNEAEIMKALNHQNIVKYEDSWTDDNYFYILMEYCKNGDLHTQIINADGCFFSEKKIINWLSQMCQAIKHCHDRSLLHRDIKVNYFLKFFFISV